MACDESNSSSETNEAYEFIGRLSENYARVHPALSIGLCICGILMNTANVVVLTRKSMRTSPINTLLTAIAISDAFVMSSYIPYSVWSTRRWSTYGWAVFVYLHSNLTVIGHAVSIWLAVGMALIRAITVRTKGHNFQWSTRRSCVLALITLAGVMFFDIPGFLSFEVVGFKQNASERTQYVTTISKFGQINDCMLLKSTLWVNGVVFKLVPCVLLTAFMAMLLITLTEVKRRQGRLKSCDDVSLAALNAARRASSARRSSESSNRTDRTTLMLIVLLAVFFVGELPQSVLLIITGLSDSEFRKQVTQPLGPLSDLSALLNSSVNFLIYCAMSQAFRIEFCKTILPKSLYVRVFNDSDQSHASNGTCVTVASKKRTSLISNQQKQSAASCPGLEKRNSVFKKANRTGSDSKALLRKGR